MRINPGIANGITGKVVPFPLGRFSWREDIMELLVAILEAQGHSLPENKASKVEKQGGNGRQSFCWPSLDTLV
jgi:hypothetical protein